MLVPNINRSYITIFEKLNNKFSWPLMGSILICRITWERGTRYQWNLICNKVYSYWLTISFILQELLHYCFFYNSYKITTFIHGFDIFNSTIWQRRIFFLHRPLNFTISLDFFDIWTSYQVLFTSRLCHTLVPQTDRDHKSFNTVKNTRAVLPKNMNTYAVLY